jgi:hypothetical protein
VHGDDFKGLAVVAEELGAVGEGGGHCGGAH